MLSKKAYLATVQDRITCEADGEMLWDSYAGSLALLQATWDLYASRGKSWGVPPAVAGYVLQNGVGLAVACEVFGVRSRVVIG